MYVIFFFQHHFRYRALNLVKTVIAVSVGDDY